MKMKIKSIKKIMKEQLYELKRGHNYLVNVGVGGMSKEDCSNMLGKLKELLAAQGIGNVIFVPDSSVTGGVMVVDIEAEEK